MMSEPKNHRKIWRCTVVQRTDSEIGGSFCYFFRHFSVPGQTRVKRVTKTPTSVEPSHIGGDSRKYLISRRYDEVKTEYVVRRS